MTHRHANSAKQSKWMVRLRDQSGQAFVEAGVVMTMLLVISLGVVTFGHAFMVSNMMTHALRDGARIAAVVPRTQRDANGLITNVTPIKDRVKTIMSQVLKSSTVNAMTINVTQPSENGINLVKVAVDASVPYSVRLPGLGDTFQLQRSVSFRDEGR